MDHAVIATAQELLAARHFPGVVAMCGDALEHEPDCIDLLVIRARAHIGLRRDVDAQADLRDIIRLEPRCGVAYRMLGELAARRDENESAAIFFREALRLDPDDQAAADWLQIVCATLRPGAVATRLPQAARAPVVRARTATGHDAARSLSAPARGDRPGSRPRFAHGTSAPDDEPTVRFARGSTTRGEAWKTPTPTPIPTPHRRLDLTPSAPLPLPPPPNELGFAPVRTATVDLPASDEPVAPPAPIAELTTRPAKPNASPRRELTRRAVPPPSHAAPHRTSRAVTRLPIPELPGFGEYLVETGILTRERLRAAQAYQRSMKVQLSTAIVTLGLATPQRVEWASVAHQSQLARDR